MSREIKNVSSTVRAEFARGDGRIKRKEDDRRKNIMPSDTLFVVCILYCVFFDVIDCDLYYFSSFSSLFI
tara:strand:- start:727 stop:936 length:210 start_codon:yes stop_codon:yes gene_type:complete